MPRRENSGSGSGEVLDTWQCLVCTLVNTRRGDRHCRACKHPRGSLAPDSSLTSPSPSSRHHASPSPSSALLRSSSLRESTHSSSSPRPLSHSSPLPPQPSSAPSGIPTGMLVGSGGALLQSPVPPVQTPPPQAPRSNPAPPSAPSFPLPRSDSDPARRQQQRGRRRAGSVVEALPVQRLSETDVQALCGNGEQECIICFEPFVAGEETKKLPCLHTFHGACIDKWLSTSASEACPLCKYNIPDAFASHQDP